MESAKCRVQIAATAGPVAVWGRGRCCEPGTARGPGEEGSAGRKAEIGKAGMPCPGELEHIEDQHTE